MDVLDDEDDRRLGRCADEEVRHGRVQTVPLGVRVGSRRRSEVSHPRREARKQPGELSPARTEVPRERLRRQRRDEVLERGRERPVRRADDGVAVAVEDDRALLCRGAGELADETALAAPGLAGDERGTTALARGARQQRPQRRELVDASGEREGRREPERPGKRRASDHR